MEHVRADARGKPEVWSEAGRAASILYSERMEDFEKRVPKYQKRLTESVKQAWMRVQSIKAI